MRHFEATGGKYPLVVKLGTITPAGADVFSYAPDEGDMVTDPHLARHLAHWGIDMARVRGARGAGAGGAGGGGTWRACVVRLGVGGGLTAAAEFMAFLTHDCPRPHPPAPRHVIATGHIWPDGEDREVDGRAGD